MTDSTSNAESRGGRGVIYARVSTEAQEKLQTIESQLAELRRHADAQGLTIAREFIDDGYSGTMLERPGLDALRDCVSAGGVETVLILCPDRLSRRCIPPSEAAAEGERGARVPGAAAPGYVLPPLRG